MPRSSTFYPSSAIGTNGALNILSALRYTLVYKYYANSRPKEGEPSNTTNTSYITVESSD